MSEHAPWPPAPHMPGPPDPEPLPLDALPPALRAHVESVAAATQTPPCMGALLSLAAVSAALRGTVEVAVDGRGWREPANIYAAAIAPPGARKSPVYTHLTTPLDTWAAEQRERIAPSWRRARDRADVAEAALRLVMAAAARGKATPRDVADARADLDEAEAAVPLLPRIVASDATPEALVRLLAEQRGAMALLGPEADALGIADGRYSDGARMDELLRAWSGEPLTVDRIGREPVHVGRPALTIGICMQPGVLEDLRHARAFRGRGLLARVLWCVPPSNVGHRLTGRDVPPLEVAAADRYARILHALLDAGEPGVLRTLELDAAARDILYRAEADIEAAMRTDGALAGICDAAAKMHGQAVRLAALLELAARAEDGRPLTAPVGPWAMDGGARLMHALATHALHVLGAAGMDERVADQQYVLRRTRELPEGRTVRDVFMATRSRPTIAEAEAPVDYLADLLDALVGRGCVRLVPQPSTGGRPPSPVVELHPSLRPTSATIATADAEVVL
jgi:replicative DNA helicase